MDLSAYSISELEALAAAALSGDADQAREIDRRSNERIRPEARRNFLSYGDRPLGWDRNGRA
jgi:hypothetical protein